MIWKSIRLSSLLAVLPALLFFGAASVEAQNTSFSVSAGVFNFDLSGTGNSPLIAMAFDWRLSSHWLAEAGVTFAFPEQQFDRTKFIIPEGQIQYQWTLGSFSPFVGGGAGVAIDSRDEIFGGNDADFNLSGGGGVRINFSDNVGVRGDFRLRAFGRDFSGSAAELRGGVFWRF